MRLILKLDPLMTIATFNDLERQLKQDYKSGILSMHLEGSETDPT